MREQVYFGMQVCFHVYMKLKPLKCGMKIYEAKTTYVNNLQVYAGAHPTDQEHSSVLYTESLSQ
jgi:hypothetical protein